MASLIFPNIFFFILLAKVAMAAIAYDRSFNQNYQSYYGGDHFKLNQEEDDQVQIVLDQSTGAGFRSKAAFQSGRFHMEMKIPKEKTRGIIPNFYLIDHNDGKPHNELDFEFVGTLGVLQTNLFAGDIGGRERKFKLGFDPSQEFHSYSILWNQHQIVFFVDDAPITVFKNRTANGAKFPIEAMHIEATFWSADGQDWAGKVNWTLAPFNTYYRNFTITGCPVNYSSAGKCYSTELEWNKEENWDLTETQKSQLRKFEDDYMFYDYCQIKGAGAIFPECLYPQV